EVSPGGGVRARLVPRLDRAALRAADLVLADTEAHREYFRLLGAPADRVVAWHFGVEPEFLSAPARDVVPRRVLFYGRYLPLHGIDTILGAAARLGDRADVVLIGRRPRRPRLETPAARPRPR